MAGAAKPTASRRVIRQVSIFIFYLLLF